MLVLDWRESGVPSLKQPTRRGFGRDLIEKALRFTLRAEAELSFGDDGAACHIELPLSSQASQPAVEPAIAQ
jgi:two-component system CheB/CheR fusion protein